MRDYDSVVKSLRCCVSDSEPCEHCNCELEECNPKTIMDIAASAIEELLAAVPHWISVEERLPEPYQNVLTCAWKLFGPDQKRVRGIDYVLNNGEWACGGESYKTMVTHWMPLPEPPKEDAE